MPVISFFKTATKKLITFKVKNAEISSAPIVAQEKHEPMSDRAGWCQLPDGTIFNCGGNNGAVTKSTYLANCASKIIEKKEDMIAEKSLIGQCAYLDGFVYLFGGADASNNPTANSEKYSIRENKLTPIKALDMASSYNTCVQHREGIIITGNNATKVWKYIPELDGVEEYRDITPPGIIVSHKILCKASGKVYLFENSRVSEYDTEWVVINTNGIAVPKNSNLLSYTVRDGDSVYFLLSDNVVYRFNFNTRMISQLETISF